MLVITAISTAISLVAVVVVYRQNRTAETAAQAANENAAAAKASVDGYINAQRPWIKVLMKPPKVGCDVPGSHDVIIKSEGLTPSKVVHYCRKVFFQEIRESSKDLPAPKYPEDEFAVPFLLMPREEISEKDGLEIFYGDQEIPDDLQEEIRNGKRRVIFYGRVQYRDVISGALHTTGFGFHYDRCKRRFMLVQRQDYNYFD